MAKWIMRSDISESELGWAAGAIDGEGCISIYGRSQRVTKKGVRALALIINVVNTDPRMPLELQKLFGGYYGKSRGRQRGKRRPTFFWLITGRPAARVLIAIRPYLVIKREQAEIGIAYAETIGKGGPLSDEIRQKRATMQAELRLLKGAA